MTRTIDADARPRCDWAAGGPPLLQDYHDREWGRPVRAFADFDIETVADYTERDVARLMADTGIVRNRAKIEATIANARVAAALDVDLSELLWSHAPPPRPRPARPSDVPASTPDSAALARHLRGLGFRFVGPTTAYALMQATGMVDDHLLTCWVPSGPPFTGSFSPLGPDREE